MQLADLHFRLNERFLYEYDFRDGWQLQVRIEQRSAIEAEGPYPVCVGGRWAGPPKDCGGPKGFLERRGHAVSSRGTARGVAGRPQRGRHRTDRKEVGGCWPKFLLYGWLLLDQTGGGKRWNIIVKCVGEGGKQSTITLGTIERLAESTTAENLGVNLQECFCQRWAELPIRPPEGV
jgi:hypothetical protein